MRLGLNQRPVDYRSTALPAELRVQWALEGKESGGGSRIRTCDERIMIPLLYRAELYRRWVSPRDACQGVYQSGYGDRGPYSRWAW